MKTSFIDQNYALSESLFHDLETLEAFQNTDTFRISFITQKY